MGKQPFRFKQFEIYQDSCAMKVGTDGVLLGAWADVENAKTILDVGAGTGLIALMCAQRNSRAQIVGVELDAAAAQQATTNAKQSPWSDRICIAQGNFRPSSGSPLEGGSQRGDWSSFWSHLVGSALPPSSLASPTSETTKPATHWLKFKPTPQFDHIISNPPFFRESKLSGNTARDTARHSHTLSLRDLAAGCDSWLAPGGKVSLILPTDRLEEAEEVFAEHGLFLGRRTDVAGRIKKAPVRGLLEFSKTKQPLNQESLTIETTRHNYTNEYIELTRDFYIKM